jgi:hypothetical protein
MIDYHKVAELMAEYFMHTQEANCLLCNNLMRSITIRKTCPQGCDGNCRFDKNYTKEDLLKVFVKELGTDLIGRKQNE